MNANIKELEENMKKFQASLKNVDLSSRVEYSWQILKECMDDNEKCLDMFDKNGMLFF